MLEINESFQEHFDRFKNDVGNPYTFVRRKTIEVRFLIIMKETEVLKYQVFILSDVDSFCRKRLDVNECNLPYSKYQTKVCESFRDTYLISMRLL